MYSGYILFVQKLYVYGALHGTLKATCTYVSGSIPQSWPCPGASVRSRELAHLRGMLEVCFTFLFKHGLLIV